MSDTAKETPHGEAAFPLISEPGFPSHTGMSLRDYFAAKAMEGMLFGCVGFIRGSDESSAYAKGPCNHAIVNRAYVLADAMIAERSKRK